MQRPDDLLHAATITAAPPAPAPAPVAAAVPLVARRMHLTRLLSIWRSAGWPCHDAVEIDLLAAGWVARAVAASGHQTLALTDAGIRQVALARQAARRSLSAHDRLAERIARLMAESGRVVWRELSLRAQVPATEPAEAEAGKMVWRMARPDVFSVRNTTVEGYLQPMVHEVKVSRADLLSDLRHAAKRASYQWLCSECYYVFPAGVAQADEIPEAFGVWTLTGAVEDGRLELVRPARHVPCALPFAVWMALAKAAPARFDIDGAQAELGAPGEA